MVSLPCCRQTKSDISTAHKMVKDGMEYADSPEAKNNYNRLENEKKMMGQLVMKIDQSNSNELRLNIQETIDKSMKIIIENQLKITREELPLKLNLFMEADGKSWEEYTFKDMPYSAIMPIFTKYKNDVILTKLLLLEELANKK